MSGAGLRSVSELRESLERGETTSVELTRFYLDRLERHGSTYNAVVVTTPSRALATAAEADRRRAAGEVGPLLGIPYGAKDVFGTRGTPTRSGSAARLSLPGDEDATAIRHLEAAGAPLLAKLALVELVGFGTRLPTSSAQGPARSPWDLRRWAGGSSGGSGAAVAAGLVPFALGSETAGSVGSPAAWCGVTGFRPSLGLFGRGGMTPLAPTLDKPGILSRTAEDARTVAQVLAGRDRHDPWSRSTTFARVAAGERRPASAVRVGFAPSDMESAAPSAARPALARAVETFRGLGFDLVEAALPPFPYRETLEAIMNTEGRESFRELVETGEIEKVLDPEARAAVRGGGPSREAYGAALRDRRRLMSRLRELWRQCDVIVTTNFTLPWPIPLIDAPFGEVPDTLGGNSTMVWAGNLAGLPAVFLPAGLSEDGFPVSIQVVGPRWGDALALAVAIAFQGATDWHRLAPPHAVAA